LTRLQADEMYVTSLRQECEDAIKEVKLLGHSAHCRYGAADCYSFVENWEQERCDLFSRLLNNIDWRDVSVWYRHNIRKAIHNRRLNLQNQS
jgi:hypothetical protein